MANTGQTKNIKESTRANKDLSLSKSSRVNHEPQEYFTIRSIKEIEGKSFNRLIIIGDRESIREDHRVKPQFEIRLGEDKEIDESALQLKVGDIVGTTFEQYNITIARPDQAQITQIIYEPKSPFIPIRTLEITGMLNSDPKIAATKKGEVGVISIDEGSENKEAGRKISISEKYIDSIKKLKKGDTIEVVTHPKTYFNLTTKSNDIIWQAVEEVKKLKKGKEISREQGRSI